jgi:KDO2-lipid IV(A) lauroyltransferase
MTRQLNEVFERWIRQAPEQWLCLKRRWPKAHKL